VELAIEFGLPLLNEAAEADDEAPLKVATGDQFANKKTGHDRLAGARVVGQQENGSKWYTSRMQFASESSGKNALSPSKLHGRPSAAISSVGLRSR
jgi:hypothetical protein